MKYESDIAEMIHEMRIKEFQLGLISEAEMREFDELCLMPEAFNGHAQVSVTLQFVETP